MEAAGAAESVFSSAPRSFRLQRRSPQADALRAAVADKLFHLLDNYSDDVLAEYIVVLVCNGKHQFHARDDLVDFLGDDAGNFVAWLWNHLSMETKALELPEAKVKLSMKSRVEPDLINGEQSLDKPNIVVEDNKVGVNNHQHYPDTLGNVESCSCEDDDGNATMTQVHQGPGKCDIRRQTHNLSPRCMSSCIETSREKSSDETRGQSTSGKASQNFQMSSSYSAGQNAQTTTEGRVFALAQPSQNSNNDLSRPKLRRGNVWDRLGTPRTLSGVSNEENENGCSSEKKRKLMFVGIEPNLHGNVKMQLIKMNRSLSSYSGDYTAEQQFDTDFMGDTPVKRKFEQMNSHDCSSYVAKCDTIDQKPTAVSVKDRVMKGHTQLSQLFTSSECRKISELPCNSSKSALRYSPCEKSPAIHVDRTSAPTDVQNQITGSGGFNVSKIGGEQSCKEVVRPSENLSNHSVPTSNAGFGKSTQPQVEKGSPQTVVLPKMVENQTPNGKREAKPAADELMDMKLKLKQVELEMLKLRSKQMKMSGGKQHDQSVNQEEDNRLRTVLVTNVHFGATKEALLSHFTKCGVVQNVIILKDGVTGQPKGSAFIIFSKRESVEKALAMNGTSFFSRVLTVVQKYEPSPTKHASISLQRRNSPVQLNQRTPYQRQSSGSNLQWKRDSFDNAEAEKLEASKTG